MQLKALLQVGIICVAAQTNRPTQAQSPDNLRELQDSKPENDPTFLGKLNELKEILQAKIAVTGDQIAEISHEIWLFYRVDGWSPMVAFLEAFMRMLQEYQQGLKAQLRVVKDEVAVVKDLLAIYHDLHREFEIIMSVFGPVVRLVSAFESAITQITREILKIIENVKGDVKAAVTTVIAGVKNVYQDLLDKLNNDADKAIEFLHQVLVAVDNLAHDDECLLKDLNKLFDDVKKAIDAMQPLEADGKLSAEFADKELPKRFRARCPVVPGKKPEQSQQDNSTKQGVQPKEFTDAESAKAEFTILV